MDPSTREGTLSASLGGMARPLFSQSLHLIEEARPTCEIRVLFTPVNQKQDTTMGRYQCGQRTVIATEVELWYDLGEKGAAGGIAAGLHSGKS